jgi:hypothetical protein
MKIRIEIDVADICEKYKDYGSPEPKKLEKFLKANLPHFTGPMRAALYNAIGHCLWYDYNHLMSYPKPAPQNGGK